MIDFPYPRELAYQLSRKKGGGLPPGVISVARPGLLGNPFPIEKFGRESAIAFHRTWLLEMTDAELREWPEPIESMLVELRPRVLARLGELRGAGMACWCGLPQLYDRDRCHRATLLEIANR